MELSEIYKYDNLKKVISLLEKWEIISILNKKIQNLNREINAANYNIYSFMIIMLLITILLIIDIISIKYPDNLISLFSLLWLI